MSIKQNGGVFGRNPTFNDVTVEGDLIINGEVFTGLDFQGGWNASTNSPALASSVGTNGEFYIVSVAGTTNLNGITNWGIGDWALFNGTVWQRVEGGADGNFNDLTANSLTVNGDGTVTGTLNCSTINGTSSVQINTGGASRFYFNSSGFQPNTDANRDLGWSGQRFKDAYLSGGIYLGGNKLDDYEEGEFAVTLTPSTSGSIALQAGADTMLYNKVGRVVHCQGQINVSSIASAVGSSIAVNLPFAKLNTTDASEASSGPVTYYNTSAYSVLPAYVPSSATQAFNIVIDPSTLANAHVFYIQFSYTAA
jgi:hypothetical protein